MLRFLGAATAVAICFFTIYSIPLTAAHSSDKLYSSKTIKDGKNGPNVINWNDPEYRLPGDLLPTVYSIRLLPFLEVDNFTTDGYIEIFVDCVRNTKSVVLNSLDITIDKLSVKVVNTATNSPLAVVGFDDQQSTLQKFTIKTAEDLVKGNKYKISMKFVSLLNDGVNGFYRSSYVENGVTKYLATTQMEAADARLAFPCFDEPNMKARFSITLGRKTTMTSSSNMPLMGTNPITNMPGYVWDFFETTPKMSTYLVALLVSEFKSTSSDPSLSNIPFRVMTRPDLQGQTAYAANIGPRILEYYEAYFGVDYSLPKMDMAAVPDFGPGAMENWGHMDFRENFLLVDEQMTSASGKQLVAEVIAHELVHQWFGDLVTMNWWNYIWLNEGFARFFQYHGADSVEPSYRLHEQFLVDTLHVAFAYDSVPTSHPMSMPKETYHIFDPIEYDKGASVLRMCESILGSEIFRAGLTRYLTQKSYSNAVENDLWNALEYQADAEGLILPAPLMKIMGTWTQTINYPLITVKRDYTGKDGAFVTQKRFVLPDSDGNTDPRENLWWVPLTYTHDFSRNPSATWLSSRKKQIFTLAATPDQWIIFNVNQTGYYRVAYDETNYRLITDQLIADHSRISLMNRAQLLDDAFTLARYDMLPYGHALDLTLYLVYEMEYVPWHAVHDELVYVDTMLHNEQQYADWRNYFTNMIKPYYNHVGFHESQSDAHLTILSRSDATYWACHMKVDDCVQNVKSQYAALMEQPDTMLSPNQKSFILCSGVENGNKAEWDFAYSQYMSHNYDFLVPITCTRDSATIYDLLNKMLDPNAIRPQDVDTLFSKLTSANPLGHTMAFDFLIRRWNDIEKALGSSHFAFFFRSLCDRSNKQDQYDKLVKLRDDHSDILGTAAEVQQGLDVVLKNIRWMSQNQQEVGSWLSTASTVVPTTTQSTSTTHSPETDSSTHSTTSTSSETDTSEQTSTTTTTKPTTTATTTTTPSSGDNIRSGYLLVPFLVIALGRYIFHA